MPLPKPQTNEKRDEFMSRCVSVVVEEGKPQEQEVRYTTDAAPSFTATVQDRATYAISRREFTDNGYLKVPGRVARSGVQYYLASELGIKDRNPMDRIGVYRPPEEVFSDASLASYADADVTIEHPGDMVDATTYRRHSVGHVTDPATQDGEYVEASLIIKDADAIKEVDSGKVELSAGYLAEYVPESGTTDAGEPYEFIQRNIKINHVALVSSARAGKSARLYDKKPQEAAMTYQVTMDGTQVEVADKSTATLIQAQFDSLQKRIGDSEKQASEAVAAKDAAEAKADKLSEDNETLKAQVSDESLEAKVKELTEARDACRKLAGDKFSCDSVKVEDNYRAALVAVDAKCHRHESWDKAPDTYVTPIFDAYMAEKEAEDEDEGKREKKAKDSWAGFGKDMSGARPVEDAQSQRDQIRQEFIDARYGRKPAQEAK